MPDKAPSRRKFLKTAGILVGGATLVCCGVGVAASQLMQPGQSQPVDTPSTQYGSRASGGKRVLVGYATAAGSTVGVAEAIGETLGKRGLIVDVQPMKADPDPSGYHYVVLGSAVHGGNWLPEAVQYVKDHQAALQQVPVALFCVHIMNLGQDEQSRSNRLAYLNSVRSLVTPQDEAFFAGKVDLESASTLERWAFQLFKMGPAGDQRDWQKINAWAESLYSPTE